MSVCSEVVGAVGYVAAMECRRVHELRPRVSTSAGQSFGVAGVTVIGCAGVLNFFVCDACEACDAQAVKAVLELHARQLCCVRVILARLLCNAGRRLDTTGRRPASRI
jgi:hypothetical protein